MNYCDGDRKLIGLFFIITWILLILILLSGCHTDNRIRTKPTLDYEIDPAKKAEYRLYVMRRLWTEKQLKDYKEKE